IVVAYLYLNPSIFAARLTGSAESTMHSQRAGEGEECPAACRAVRLIGAGAVLMATIAAPPLALRGQTVPGDANCHGTTNEADVVALAHAVYAGLSACVTADVNGDGRLSAPDFIPLAAIIVLLPAPTSTPSATATVTATTTSTSDLPTSAATFTLASQTPDLTASVTRTPTA